MAESVKNKLGYNDEYVDDYVAMIGRALNGTIVDIEEEITAKYEKKQESKKIIDQSEMFLQGRLKYEDVATESAYDGARLDQKLTPMVKSIVIKECKNKIAAVTMKKMFESFWRGQRGLAVRQLEKVIKDTKDSIIRSIVSNYNISSVVDIPVDESMTDDQKEQFKLFKFIGIPPVDKSSDISKSDEFIKKIEPIISESIFHHIMNILKTCYQST